MQNLSDPPHLIVKASELVSVFEAKIGHSLGLLKVKAGNLTGILIVVRVELQNLHHINILYTTDKKFRRQLPFIPSYSFTMGNSLPWQQRDTSISQMPEGVEGPDLVQR